MCDCRWCLNPETTQESFIAAADQWAEKAMDAILIDDPDESRWAAIQAAHFVRLVNLDVRTA